MTQLCSICDKYKEEGYTCDYCGDFICEGCSDENIITEKNAPDDIKTICVECDIKRKEE
jgi:hypothetical protein